MLAVFGFTMASIIFSILCVFHSKILVIQKNRASLTAIAVGILFCLCGVLIWSVLSGRHTLTKTIFSAYFFILFCLVLIFILQRTGFFSIVSSAEGLKEYLKRAGVWMPILYILLQFLQVIILPIPSLVSTVVGVALFGAFWAMVYSLAGILLGSVVAFFIGRKLGNKAVAWMVGEETLVKWQKKLKGKDNLVLTWMFVLPFFPDDILCFLAGLSTMTTKYFLIVVLLARVVGIFSTCYSIDFIPFTTWWGISLWVIFILCLIIALVYMHRNMAKIQQFIRKIQRKNKMKK